MSTRFLLAGAALVILLTAGFLAVKFRNSQTSSKSAQTSQSASQTTLTPSVDPTPAKYYFPIHNYTQRITVRWYGKLVTATDRQAIACGAQFQGYHTGDDLEVTPTELAENVPVVAVASGTVRQVGPVNGYGGLLVVEYQLDDQSVTAYYGHINTNKTRVLAGQAVSPGQVLSILGDNCSAQTDGERKHLHFALHKGSTIDVRGYVSRQIDLADWLDPKATLEALGATEP